jgi:hypothetical protein
MPEENTTAIVQRYLGELLGDAPAESVVRVLLGRAVPRLQRFCATLLHHDYPRLTHAPLNLQTDGAEERLLRPAMLHQKPGPICCNLLTTARPKSPVVLCREW